MKLKIMAAVAALALASGTAYAASTMMDCCAKCEKKMDCCDKNKK